MSSAQRKWAPTSRWILEFFPVSCLSYSTVLLNCIREHPHGVVHRDYFLYGLLPVFAISEGGDKDQSLKSTSYLRGKSLSYQHPGRRCHQHECKAFNIQAFNFIWCSPACVAGTTVDSNVFGRHRHRQVYAFMKSNNSCFWSSKIISSKKCVHNFPTPYLQPRLGSSFVSATATSWIHWKVRKPLVHRYELLIITGATPMMQSIIIFVTRLRMS